VFQYILSIHCDDTICFEAQFDNDSLIITCSTLVTRTIIPTGYWSTKGEKSDKYTA